MGLTAKPWFPPVVRQQGNSCAQQAGLYYLLTAERNRQRGVSSRNSPSSRLSPYQSYAILADNQAAGTHVEDGWQLAEAMGVPLESDVPRGGSVMMHGFDKYVRAASRKPDRWQYWPMRSAGDLPAVRKLLATGHLLAPQFLAYWEQHGGLPVFGYPISEAFFETSPTNGKTYLVQYFERNRFEYHPENSAPYDVLLGLLGVQVLKERGWIR